MFRLTRPTSPPLDTASTSNGVGAATCRQQQALARSGRKLARHHPNVKVPPRLQDKPIKEQIRRCCDRFKSHASTVDTLIRALSTILRNPQEGKYRRINTSNPGYQKSLAKAPGAEQLMFALGFNKISSQVLFLPKVDVKMLSMTLQVLEQTKETPEYQQTKKKHVFAKEVTALLKATPSEAEQAERQRLLSKLPREPDQGRSAVMMIQLGDHDNANTLTRRFDGDDTLQDVLHWLGGSVGTAFAERLASSRQWSLVDINRQGQVPVDCDPAHQHKTLQHLGFWPSGRLLLRPSTAEWMNGGAANMEMGASRGLGSAPSETLQY